MKFLIFILLITSQVFCAKDFTSPEYQSKTRQEKLDLLWEAINEDKTGGVFSTAEDFQEDFFELSMDVTLNFESDVMPEGREKYLHSVGTVAKVEFIPEPTSNYAGLFKGSDSALIRLSLTADPDYSKPQAQYAKNNYIPSMALKFLIDGKPSANVVAFFSNDGVDCFNFFDKDMTNHLPAPVSKLANQIFEHFATATRVVKYTGVRRLSENNQDGTTNKNAKYPFKLTFRAPKEFKDRFTDDYTEDYRETLAKVAAGTTILEVYATEDPETGCLEKVGTIKTTSEFTTSTFGDENLFFQHQNFMLDLENYPQWSPYTPFFTSAVCFKGKNFGKINANPLKPEGGCPFANIKKR